MNRRKFIGGLGLGIIALQFTVLDHSQAVTRHPFPRQFEPFLSEPDNALIVSSESYWLAAHHHRLLLPFGLLESPPSDGIILTTEAGGLTYPFHSHAVALTEEQLFDIANGKLVEVIDSTIGEHTFGFYLEGGIKKVD